MSGPWVAALADWLAGTPTDSLPPEVEWDGCRLTLDTVACALGALDHPAALAMGELVRSLGGQPESSLARRRPGAGRANRLTRPGP